jgi:hypothetical protein
MSCKVMDVLTEFLQIYCPHTHQILHVECRTIAYQNALMIEHVNIYEHHAFQLECGVVP